MKVSSSECLAGNIMYIRKRAAKLIEAANKVILSKPVKDFFTQLKEKGAAMTTAEIEELQQRGYPLEP